MPETFTLVPDGLGGCAADRGLHDRRSAARRRRLHGAAGPRDLRRGRRAGRVTVTPLADALNEGTESVVVTLVDGPDLRPGPRSAGTAPIEDALPGGEVVASDAVASEVALNPGAFTFTRVGSASQPLTVNVTSADRPHPGGLHSRWPRRWSFRPVRRSVTVAVTPLADLGRGSARDRVVTLASGGYVIGTPASASVSLLDDPQPRITVVAVDDAASEAGPDDGVAGSRARVRRTWRSHSAIRWRAPPPTTAPPTSRRSFRRRELCRRAAALWASR